MTLLAVVVVAVALLAAWRRPKRAHSREHPRRRGPLLATAAIVALQVLIGTPASGQPFDCKEAPNPERPGAGMVGAIDPAPMGTGYPGSAYDEYGYAGLVWHTYDLGCGPQGVTNPNALVDTWLGNELFNIGKNLVGATNGLHYALLSGDLLGPLDDAIATGSTALYESVFAPWFGVVAVVLAVLLFRYIWQGDLAAIGKRTLWALAALWFAAATYLTPLVYTHALDDVVLTGTSAVQAGFLREVGIDERNALPTVLHDQVVYRNWARGEFGSPDSPQAQELGRELLAAQAWSKREVLRGEDAGSPEEKKQQFEDVAGRMGSAYTTFQGVDGSRVGAGLLAALQGLAYTSFQLLAKASILLAQVLLRMVILAGPLIGLAALVYHQVLRSIGRVAGAAMLNVVMVSAMAGLHTMILTWIFDPLRGFSVLTQMLLAALVTTVFLLLVKPVRRIGQMVQLAVGRSGTDADTSPGIFSRFRGRKPEQPQDDFWDQVRNADDDATSRETRRARGRPEADAASVAGVAQRLDRDGSPELTGGGSATAPVERTPTLPASGTATPQRPGASRALPEGRSSRVVDTAPVAGARWDVVNEPVVVPSRAGRSAWSEGASRPHEPDVVSGRQVDVVFRPSRGLEVADGQNER